MNQSISNIQGSKIENRIFTIRGVQVMLDKHLAEMYEVDTKRLNEQVKRNSVRFPESFRFQLTIDEVESLRSHFATLNFSNLEDEAKNDAIKMNASLRSQNATLKDSRGKHTKYLPYVFTEQGVAMLSAVLRSETAVKVSIRIIQAFVEMRKFISENAIIFQRLDKVEQRQLKTEEKFDQLFDALQSKNTEPKQGVFFDGQVFDAHSFISDIIRKANTSIVLIDNYIDDRVLSLFTKRKKGVKVIIYSKSISKQLAIDVEKFNSQYEPIEMREFKEAHDRFLVIDKKELYHIGASLKDLGKKWFAFSKMEKGTAEVLLKLNKI